MITKEQLNFVKYFFGVFLLIVGVFGVILPIMPGLIFVSMGLALLEDIPFFKNIKMKVDEKIELSLKTISKRYKHKKENVT